MNATLTLKTTILGSLLLLAAVFSTPGLVKGQEGNPNAIPERLIAQIRELQGLAMAPVPLNYDGKDPALVGLGSYLVNTNCVSCHTSPTYKPDGDPYRGMPAKVNTTNYLAGGSVFGPFTSRNLTPDTDNGKPAGLTFDEFERAMRRGEDVAKKHPQMGPLLQVMPWPEYSKLTDRDLRAIYEYLSALPHTEPAPK